MDTNVASARYGNEMTLEGCDRSELASFVLWLLEEQSVTPSEGFEVYRHRGSLDATLVGLTGSHPVVVRMSSRARTSSTRLTVLP